MGEQRWKAELEAKERKEMEELEVKRAELAEKKAERELKQQELDLKRQTAEK